MMITPYRLCLSLLAAVALACPTPGQATGVASSLHVVPELLQQRYTISGYVRDAASSETLIGASITDTRTGVTVITNAYGFFSLTVPQGQLRLRIGQVGYKAEYREVVLHENTTLNISLYDDTQLAEAVVTARPSETGVRSTKLGAIELTSEQLQAAPALLGEPDVMKTIQLLPGVQPSVDGTAGVNVRGGSPDQNLILLDGIPLYNVDHALGLFSVFSPEAVKKMSFYKASYPARYGGRLSSVVDVRTNDGSMQRYRGLLSVGLLSARVHAEGPIVKDRMSFHVAARRSYLDLLARPLLPSDDRMLYYFYDVNAKLNYRFSDRSRLYLMLYGGNDALTYEYSSSGQPEDGSDLMWGNRVASLRWNYVLNHRLFSNTTVAFNRYHLHADSYSISDYSGRKQRFDSHYGSEIRDWSVATDFHYYPTPDHTIRFGAAYTYHTFRPQVVTMRTRESGAGLANVDSTQQSLYNSNIYAHEVNTYIEDDWTLREQLQLNAGAHISYFGVRGKAYLAVQPRVSVRYAPAQHWAIKAGYTQMRQHVHLLASLAIAMPTDLWVPVTDQVRPMRANQYSTGLYYTGFKGWEVSAEAYYKSMRHVLEYRDGVSYFGATSHWETKVGAGRGRSYGFEVMAQRTEGRTTGWLSYAWSKAERKFDNGLINRGRWFPYTYDRRHSFNVMLNHKFSPRFELGASWVFYTGGAVTLATGHTHIEYPRGMFFNSASPGLVTSRNNFRLPATHRLNLSLSWHKPLKRGGTRTWNLSVFNAYNAMNPSFVYGSDNSAGNYVVKKLTLLPIIPSITYTIRF
ncbi:MAG: TonB-dependent receptor [Bacteroidales bacterium]|nr:TonB-dependent receptor [Bacteroidales bacterium]